jgi:hypothetical protein
MYFRLPSAEAGAFVVETFARELVAILLTAVGPPSDTTMPGLDASREDEVGGLDRKPELADCYPDDSRFQSRERTPEELALAAVRGTADGDPELAGHKAKGPILAVRARVPRASD